MVTLIKSLGGNVESTHIVTGRCIFGLLLLSPMLIKTGLSALRSPQLKLHLFRGVFVAIAINLGFYSLTILPVTTVTVLFFTAPLFVTLLAGPLLDERVGWKRFLATAAGFAGTVIVLNPVSDTLDYRLFIPVLSSAFFSVSLVLSKQLSKTDSPWVLMFYMFLCTLIFTLPFSYQSWENFDTQYIDIILLIAIVATMRTYADIRGYSVGDVSFVAPFQYLRILFVGAIAYILFDELLSFHELIGAMVIIFSTLYIAQREYRLGKTSPITGRL